MKVGIAMPIRTENHHRSLPDPALLHRRLHLWLSGFPAPMAKALAEVGMSKEKWATWLETLIAKGSAENSPQTLNPKTRNPLNPKP